MLDLILAAGPGARGYQPAVQDAPVPGQHSSLEFWVPVILAVLVFWALWWLFKKLWKERPGGPEDNGGWNWWQWRGPRDWPKLPPTPKGSGPTPDYVPDEWVFEEFGKPPRLIPVLPPKDEV